MVAVAIAGLMLATSIAQDARASSDPLDFFRKYVTGPIDKALRSDRSAKVAARPKPTRKVVPVVAAVEVPLPRLKPPLSVSAGVDTDWRPPVQVASLGAEGWTDNAADATAGEAGQPAAKVDVPAPEAVVVPESVAPNRAIVPVPVSRPALKQLASLPPRPEEATVPLSTLATLGVSSIPLAPIDERGCAIAHPVAVASLDDGDVALTTKAILNEPMAEMVAKWVRDDIAPAATRILKADLIGLRVAASYDCRPRDNIVGAPLSEHAFGNALDISAFRVGKRWIEVGAKDNSADDARFLDAVRAAACERFMTVLGPGQPYHDTHFHVDLEHRGKSGAYKLCQ
jgi:hypothetical protein